MKRKMILTAIVTAASMFFAVSMVEAQGMQMRQRRRDGSCTQPAAQAQQAMTTAPTFAPGSFGPRGRGFGYRWMASSPSCCGRCWAAQSSAPATQPSNRQSSIAPAAQPVAPVRAGRGAGGFGPPPAMRNIHALLTEHLKIHREVQDIPGGVLTVTTSDDPAVARLIQTHVTQMQEALKQGRPIRQWDPLFVQVFANRDKIQLEVEQLGGGVKVREVCDDPQVTKLIRQHAHRGVSEFVSDGWSRVHQPTPMPGEN